MTFVGMKRLAPVFFSFLFSFFLTPALASGQQAPQPGGVSIWGAGGFAAPSEGNFHSTFGAAGGIDYFLTREIAIGATAGGWRAGTDLGSHANEFYFDAAATYSWERGRLHPFAQGGLGFYRLDFPARSAKTHFGGFAGAGLDVFVGRSWAAEGLLRYHVTQSVQGLGGSFFEGLAGVKFFF